MKGHSRIQTARLSSEEKDEPELSTDYVVHLASAFNRRFNSQAETHVVNTLPAVGSGRTTPLRLEVIRVLLVLSVALTRASL